MAVINSVLGPLDTAELGFTLMHEHIIGSAAGIYQNYPELLGPQLMDRIVAGLTQAKEGGVNTIVDASTFDLGRDVTLLEEASRRSGVNIITCTGWYFNPAGAASNWSSDKCSELFIREIKEGIAGTKIKAGILKSASHAGGVTPTGEVILRAVAKAHIKTKAPIMLHSNSLEQAGREQLAILKDEGVDLKWVKVDHSLDTTDVEYLSWLLDQGAYLGMERIPGFFLSSQAHVKVIKELMEAGWAHRLLPSHDHTLARHSPELPQKVNDHLDNCNPHGFLYIKKVYFPQLLEAGIKSDTINSLFVDGPRNFFEGISQANSNDESKI